MPDDNEQRIMRPVILLLSENRVAHTVLDLLHSIGAWAKAVGYDCSWHRSQQRYSQLRPIDFFVDLQPVGWNLYSGLFDPQFKDTWGSGTDPFDSLPGFLLAPHWYTDMVYRTVSELFSRLQKHSHQSDPDTMTITALEAPTLLFFFSWTFRKFV